MRFPLAIPATLSTGKDERSATTRNVSASGVLLVVDQELRVGQDIRFSLRMPGDVLGASRDVMVRCSGRVVRCSTSQDQYQAAATIDEYRFVEQ
ncbi:MAG: PilZ domain-containing protein [Terracidiphilus sp.]